MTAGHFGIEDCPFLYSLLLEVDPDRGGPYLRWLDGGHIAEVVSFPGIRWARRIKLQEAAADGWNRYLVIYGLESSEVLAHYRASDLFKSFAGEVETYAGLFRVQRFFGEVDFRVG